MLARVGLEQGGLSRIGKDLVSDAITTVARLREYHPIRDWLTSLRHDGTPRLDTWLSHYMGAQDTAYSRGVGRAFLISMVARVMRPGCKVDHALVLTGPQGIGKSSACRILSGDDYFSDSMPSVTGDSKEARQHLMGKWLVELSELGAYVMTQEGSVVDLLRMRSQTYRDRTLVFGGTPIFKGDAVCALYEDSDQRVFEVRCVECEEFAEIEWKALHFQKDALEKGVEWCCPNCGCFVPETRKAEMVSNGRWRATNPENKKRVGFKINSLVSPHYNARWSQIVTEFLICGKDPAALQAWTNLLLGEGWEQTGEGVDESALTLVPASLDQIPESGLYLTGGCDVQTDRVELSTVVWDAEGCGTVLAHELLYGDPLENDVWIALADMIARRFKHPRGGTLAYDKVLVDAGDGVRAASIQGFCRGRAPLVFPSKGVGGWKQPAVTLGKAADKTIRLQLLGVDGLKDRVHRMATAGTLQFGESLPPTYWEQLAGEEIRVRYSRGFAIREWHQITGRRSEGLDCAVMALAAKHLIAWQPDRRAEELASAAPKKPRTVIRSKWLEG